MAADRSSAEVLDQGLAELGAEPGPAARRQLLDLAERLGIWADRFNLTAHRSVDAILRRLVLDALALERALPQASELADLGSGAGFPGLPIAIVRPATRVLLVEARERRHHFQRMAIRELGLRNVKPLRGRIEELAPEISQGVVAQALADPARAARLGVAWCRPGGWIAIPGGARPPAPGSVPGLVRHQQRAYRVPLGGPGRTLWLAWRTA